jgi:hypothetical protein
MEESKKILYRLYKSGSITDEELDILLQAVNKNDSMFRYPESNGGPSKCPNQCPNKDSNNQTRPIRPIGDIFVYQNSTAIKF